jgi:hypothetical protein
MNADLHMSDDLRTPAKAIVWRLRGTGHRFYQRKTLRVKVNGVDVFKPQTGSYQR